MEYESLAKEMMKGLVTVRGKFSGSDAVKWLLSTGKAGNEAAALELGNVLIRYRLVEPMMRANVNGSSTVNVLDAIREEEAAMELSAKFSNSGVIYCFCSDLM
jgi:hypothetical protein